MPLPTFGFSDTNTVSVPQPNRPAAGEVAVHLNPPTRERRRFDKAAMPEDIARKATRDARCETQLAYDCWWWWNDDVAVTWGETTWVAIRVEAVHVELFCHATLFLPANASPALIAHEEGHAELAEHVAGASIDAARAIAQDLVGRWFVGRGSTAAEAANAAASIAEDAFGREWNRIAVEPLAAAHRQYDAVTDHGQRATPPAAAVRIAIDSVHREAATSPTGHEPLRSDGDR